MAELDERAATEPRGGPEREVTIRQGGAREVSAEDVTIRQGGALRVQAEKIKMTQSGVGLARAGELRVTAGRMGGVLADHAELDQTAAQFVAARGPVEMDQAAAGVIVAGTANVRDSTIGLVLTGRLEGRNIRVLMGPRAAFAFGAGAGLVLWLLSAWRRGA